VKRLASAAVAVAAVLAVAGCQPAQGPSGTVVDRDKTYWSATKQWTYKLTVRKPDGTRATFKVLRSDYKSCPEGAAYPKCAG
jgi:sugar lactone lactonase YvrE